MSSRDAILGRIRRALAGDPPHERPAMIEVWPRENPPTEQMAERFTQELEAISGELHRCASMDDARAKLTGLLEELECTSIGGTDRPLCREVASELAPDRVDWGESEVEPKKLAELSAGLVAADYLVADTGTAMVACGTPHERLMCYLPPVCFVIATTDRLVEHLPAAWEEIAPRAADPATRGEFVLITGPSRTADIEKILILGVHGPKRLIVLLVG